MFTLAHAFKAAELLLTLYLIMFLSLVTLLIIIHQQLLSSMYHFLLLVSTPSSTDHLSSQHLQQNIINEEYNWRVVSQSGNNISQPGAEHNMVISYSNANLNI